MRSSLFVQLWVTQFLATSVVLLQQLTWILGDPQLMYVDGPTRIYAVMAYDWTRTLLLLGSQLLLLVVRYSRNRLRKQVAFGVALLILAFLFLMTFKMSDMSGHGSILGRDVRHPPANSFIQIPVEDWQDSWFLVQLRLDPLFNLILLLTCTSLLLLIWALSPGAREYRFTVRSALVEVVAIAVILAIWNSYRLP